MLGPSADSDDDVFALTDQAAQLHPEELDLVEQVRRLVKERIAPRAAFFDESQEFPWENVRLLNDLGLSAMFIPEEYGGLPLSFAAYLMCLREISRGCAATGLIWATNFHAANPVVEFASSELKRAILPGIAAGSLAAIAITESGGGSDATQMRTTITAAGDDLLINGEKFYITNGDVAKFILVFGKYSSLGTRKEAITAVIVEQGARGLTVPRKERKLGHCASSTVALQFDNVRVPRANLVGEPGEGLRVLLGGLHRSRLSMAAHSLGIARAALDDALTQGNSRKVANKLLLEHQANQFRLAELAGELALCESMLWSLSRLRAAQTGGYGVLSSVLKLRAADLAVDMADFALQLCGGAGYCKEYRAERLWRDARLAPIGEGSREWLATVVGRRIAARGRLHS